MSTGQPPTGQPTHQPTEEELLAAYEAEIKKLRVEHVLLENVVTVINLGMRRTGLMPGTESERDPAQVRVAVESVRALLPLLASVGPEQLEPLRQALSQLQMAYVQITDGASQPAAAGQAATPAPGQPPSAPGPGAATPPIEATPADQEPGGPGPAQRSGRLWLPGQ